MPEKCGKIRDALPQTETGQGKERNENQMKQIIFDCDCTAGIPGYPMDDALALFYLLGRPELAEVLGVCCTFGNGTADEVFAATRQMLSQIGYDDLPVLAGANAGQDPVSPAAHFIVEQVNRAPGEISIAAVGSLTNLYGAFLLDQSIFEKIREIVLMGGYTEPLLYHGRHLDELNFSAAPKAAATVLNQGRRISILTGNNTLEPSFLHREEFFEQMSQTEAGRMIARMLGYRFDVKQQRNGEAVSYCWDVVASIYLLHPELFEEHPCNCYLTEKSMASGWLGVTQSAPDTCLLNLPTVKDRAQYRREMYAGWRSLPLKR